MADARVTVSGYLIGVVEERWNGYRRKDGSEAPAGVVRSVWLSPGFSHAPMELRVEDPKLLAELGAEAFGTPVACDCSLRTFVSNDRAVQQFTLAGWVPTEAAA